MVRAVLALAAFIVPFVQMPVAKADTVTATLVRTINTSGSAWVPHAPDPAGVAYMPGIDALLVTDSEVDETTGAGYHGVNTWIRTRATDQHIRTFTTLAYTAEPTGAGFDPTGAGRLLITSDSGEKLFIVLPGGDGQFGTGDDTRTTILLAGFGITDPEDVAYNTANGHIYIADGTPVEVWDLNPVDGIFGNGNDTATHFDVAVYGGRDSEGLGYDPVRNTLLVMDRGTKRIYEVTAAGALVRTIVATGITGLQNPSDVEVAPASNGSAARNYWITDRTVDNGTNSSEDDGLMFEVAIPGSGSDTPPTVTLTAPAEGATVAGNAVALAANAGDNLGVTRVDWFLDGGASPIASDTSSSGGWTGTWNSTLASDGPHTITARATDTIGQTANDANAVTVENVDASPTVTLTAPAEGATVGGTVNLAATANDDRGVAKVEWFLDGGASPIATDTSSAGGWTGTWNSTGATDGPHTITARVTDTGNQTANDQNAVTVDNVDELPTVTLTSPAEGANVGGASVNLAANAGDDNGVTRVDWFLDGGASPIASDTNSAGGWTGSWDSRATSNGPHTITARATDTAGQTATDANGVTVFNDAGPSVTLDTPAEGATVVGSITLSATATDDVAVTQVQFMLDGVTSLGVDANPADGWTRSWDSTSATDGPHTITAVATDTGGHTATDGNAITVDNIDQSPTVALTSPAQGELVSTTTVLLSANASDDKGVTEVEFFLNGSTSLGVDGDPAGGWVGSWDTTGYADGSYAITAVATDTGSNSTTSASRTVTVDTTAPDVGIVSPTEGSTVTGTITITAAASDTNGVASVQFLRDGVAIGTDTNGADGWSIQWNSALSSNGTRTLTARATDRAGNPATSAEVHVTVANTLVLDIPVATGTDDAEQKLNSNVVLNSTDLDMMDDTGNTVMSTVGIRFAGVNLPAGATVTNAYVQFTSDEATTITSNLTIRAQESPAPAGFTTLKNGLSSRPRTDASVTWSVPGGWPTKNVRGALQRTPDLAGVLDEVIDQVGWASGNPIVIIVTGSTTSRLVASAFEDGTANRPVLHIEYTF